MIPGHTNADAAFLDILHAARTHGLSVTTRNAQVRRLLCRRYDFNRTPLVTVRKTAWKNALREMEFFLRGGVHLDDLHPSTRHWWEPFCVRTPSALLHSYGTALRKVYRPDKSRVLKIKRKSASAEDDAIPDLPKLDREEGVWGELTGRSMVSNSGQKYVVLKVVGRRGSNNVYRIRFLKTNYLTDYRGDVVKEGRVKDPYERKLYAGNGSVGKPDKKHPMLLRAKQAWDHMMQRCYDHRVPNFVTYGARGVRVCERWKCFEFYLNDLSKIPGYAEWLQSPTTYQLDKDYYGSSVYSPSTCVFLPSSWNSALSKSQGVFQVYESEDDAVGEFLTAKDMNDFLGLPKNSSRGVERLGMKVVFKKNTTEEVFRYSLMDDQIEMLADGVARHPYSRRNLITTWIPQHVAAGLVNPTNCHGTVIQAFVGHHQEPKNRLHLFTYQRSCDVVCGLPHNWLQYWAFLLWLAHRTGTVPGSLMWMGGDVHVYDAHRELSDKIEAEAGRRPGFWEDYAPKLVYTPTSDDFKADDFTLDRPYEPLVTDKAEMIV